MKLYTFLLGLVLVLFAVQSKAQASKNVHQIIALEDDEKALKTLNIYVYGEKVEIIKIRGTRVQAKTRISIGLNNLPFLNYLADNKRYQLESIPNDGETARNIEAKAKNNLVVRGENYTEDISYVFYVPEYIENIRIYNIDTNFD